MSSSWHDPRLLSEACARGSVDCVMGQSLHTQPAADREPVEGERGEIVHRERAQGAVDAPVHDLQEGDSGHHGDSNGGSKVCEPTQLFDAYRIHRLVLHILQVFS